MNRFSRTEILIGKEKLDKLRSAHVAVFGAGGVGGYVIEALARSGVGKIDIIDGDRISITNLNRQIVALESTVGEYKAEAAKARILQINPAAKVRAYNLFFDDSTADTIHFHEYDYVVDAIDTVAGKIGIIQRAKEADVSVISSMGAGNKLDATAFRVADISKTRVCPLARVMRRELKKRGIANVKVVYSEEEALTPLPAEDGDKKGTAGRPVPGSVAFVPSAAGLIIAGEVFKDICL
jgi:Dinucleotide-utilizing enzymes involved in molybdopterin and thiamine biosynthesis family 1